jgi:leucyl-tRNA synthetase
MIVKKYNHCNVEPKWQKFWEEKEIYKAKDFDKRKKFYQLIEFPYPSGAGLHVGHVRSWASMDAYTRKKRMEGYNVLFPIGWDAFGLPAENYAIKTGIHPSITVSQNIKTFKRQIKSLGLSFDWDREINTTDPSYYKWTQWIFIQLFKKGLAYREEVPVNWCPFCKTNLADEEVLSDGRHERCGNITEKRLQKQWLLRITKYADRLLTDLNTVDYSSRIKIQQENWIGKKEWIDIIYPVEGLNEEMVVSTTRPDTNFGATFIVISPEHPFVKKILIGEIKIDNVIKDNLSKYVDIAKSKSDIERVSEGKEKTGVFTGLYAINRLNSKKLPVFIADFVLMSVGTGAVVGVPGHDVRDFEFAKKFGLPVLRVVEGKDKDASEIEKIEQIWEGEGKIINSDLLNGLNVSDASKKIMDYLENKGWGKRVTRYHLHDWIFSRQHYWGEPIPIIYCDNCGIVTVPEKDLPVELPFMEKYQPAGTGESPLANNSNFVNVKCPSCGSNAKRETDTMPNWAGSNWYYLGYLMTKSLKNRKDANIFKENNKEIDYWMPVDFYQGGFEHTTLHLLYSRFIYKFLYDIRMVPSPEPYLKRRSHGIVLGSDGRKMSKSFGNVINPDVIVEKFGADATRIYEMFIGPFDQMVIWKQESLEGCYRFINRLWKAFNEKTGKSTSLQLSIKLHQTVKKVSEDIENLKFNTAVASLMEFLNFWEDENKLSVKDRECFCLLMAPFAPYLAEEVWQILHKTKNGFINSIHIQSWPSYDPKLVIEDKITVAVQINGKLRGTIEVDKEKSKDKEYISNLAKTDNKVSKWLEERKIIKEIYIEGRLLNFVV